MGSAPRGIQYVVVINQNPPQVRLTPSSSLEEKSASLKQKRGMDYTDTLPSKCHFVDAQPSPSCLLIPLECKCKCKWENDSSETPSNKRRCLNSPLPEVVSRPSPVQHVPALKWKCEDKITESLPSKCPNHGSISDVTGLESYTPVVVFPVSNLMTPWPITYPKA